ncbi:MAG: hypothetical protein IT558_04500 [Alphaproteobacteria bacterium]|nr:hypothetical protein [Alphaproteobacteria bacterium]
MGLPFTVTLTSGFNGNAQIFNFPAGDLLLQNTTNPDALYEDASHSKSRLPALASKVMSIANNDLLQYDPGKYTDNKLGHGYCVYPDLKSKTTALKKANGDYGGDMAGVCDIARMKMEVLNTAQLAAVCTAFKYMYENQIPLDSQGTKIVSLDDKFRNPAQNGHRALVAKVAIPLGNDRGYHVAEMMVMHDGFQKDIDAADRKKGHHGGHNTYALARELAGRFAMQNLGDGQKVKANHERLTGHMRSVPLGEHEAKINHKLHSLTVALHTKLSRTYGLDKIPFAAFEKIRGNELESQATATQTVGGIALQPIEA